MPATYTNLLTDFGFFCKDLLGKPDGEVQPLQAQVW